MKVKLVKFLILLSLFIGIFSLNKDKNNCHGVAIRSCRDKCGELTNIEECLINELDRKAPECKCKKLVQ